VVFWVVALSTLKMEVAFWYGLQTEGYTAQLFKFGELFFKEHLIKERPFVVKLPTAYFICVAQRCV
jgi:hypothetical protein